MEINFEYYKIKLEEAGVIFDTGMSESEIAAAENFYKFKFPPDLKDFLMFALPVSKGWTNWRKLGSPEVDNAFNRIYEGIYFDIENNAFWLDDWNEKPEKLSDVFSIAKQKIEQVPKLIPILGHRYIPDSPNERNNPVFSVYQTDIIYYGSNLWNYFGNEFYYYFQTPSYQIKQPIRQIEFWSLFAEDLI